jgi:hypothetical protein
MQWGAFIAVELQLFLALPILVIIYRWHKITGLVLISLLGISGSITAGTVIWYYNFMPAYLFTFDIDVVSAYGI